MTGTLVNVAAVLAGSAVGLGVGRLLPERVKAAVLTVLGLGTLVIGVGDALSSANLIVPILALVLGTVAGELLRLDKRIDAGAERLRALVGGGGRFGPTFGEGFVTATLLYL